jgi:hypothetical protein
MCSRGVLLQTHKTLSPEEEEEGLHAVFKRLRRNGHQLEKGCCEKLSFDCHSKRG